MNALAVVPDAPESSTIADAERIAEREARRAISEAREAVKRAATALRPAAASPLFGNGLHKGLSDAVAQLGAQDEALARLERAVHTYFHGGDEA